MISHRFILRGFESHSVQYWYIFLFFFCIQVSGKIYKIDGIGGIGGIGGIRGVRGVRGVLWGIGLARG